MIGLSVAWRLRQRGLSVAVVDPDPGHGTSWVAAGMLAPVSEVAYGEERLLGLNIDSARLWPSFAAELEELSGEPSGLWECGTLVVASDPGDRAELEALMAFQNELGLGSQWLSSRESRNAEPLLAPGIRGAILVDQDHQVDNRVLIAALLAVVRRSGVVLYSCAASEIEISEERALGVLLAPGPGCPKKALPAGTIVVSAGAWSSQLKGVPERFLPHIRPVKGQLLRLLGNPEQAPVLGRTVRAQVNGRHIYIVPRLTGEVVVGATSEEMGFDTSIRAGAVRTLLDDASRVVPAVDDLKLVESLAGLRPGTPDNRPLIGPSGLDGLVLATGHGRNGILLAPLTAQLVAGWICDSSEPPKDTSPSRFFATRHEARLEPR